MDGAPDNSDEGGDGSGTPDGTADDSKKGPDVATPSKYSDTWTDWSHQPAVLSGELSSGLAGGTP